MKRARRFVETELVTLPFMGLFVILVPMLLLSAVFLEITVIDMNVASGGEAEATEIPGVAVRITDEVYVVQPDGESPQTILRESAEAEAMLGSLLAAFQGRFPASRSVVIVSEPDTRYEDIIRVMDVARESGLPDASLLGARS
jgi:biopolymer transport protein ExbD